MFHMLIHFVDKEFEFVDIPIETSVQEMLLDVTTVVGLIVVIHTIGMLMIRSVMMGA